MTSSKPEDFAADLAALRDDVAKLTSRPRDFACEWRCRFKMGDDAHRQPLPRRLRICARRLTPHGKASRLRALTIENGIRAV
jgi:hypothetical protein